MVIARAAVEEVIAAQADETVAAGTSKKRQVLDVVEKDLVVPTDKEERVLERLRLDDVIGGTGTLHVAAKRGIINNRCVVAAVGVPKL